MRLFDAQITCDNFIVNLVHFQFTAKRGISSR